ncbi:MAG: Gfo/Idh/MocA family oxidoreductase [Acidobacteria bacterium]|nr:Gfo/Idh/MocA family oxidoreductase [Acidobacteriota bacterium]
MNRRKFLSASASMMGTSHLWSQANDRVRIAVIGMGGRGNDHLKVFSKVTNCEIGAVVDPDGNRAEKAAQWVLQNTGKRAAVESDMRRVFEDKNIDAVTIATTNHWHALTAIWAMQAGKDVYVEKPVSHNLFESEKLVEFARKLNRVVQGGTQRRSYGVFRKAMKMLHDGAIGDIYQAKWIFPGRRDSIGYKPIESPPSWLNWDLWLGPAQMQDYHGNLVHYNWHWFWDFGNGELGNNGIHLVDISRWGMNKGLPVKIYSTGGRFGYKDQAETPNTQTVTWTYADGSEIIAELRGLYTSERMSWDFFGSKGHMHIEGDGKVAVTMGRNKEPEPAFEPMPEVNHYANFVDAIRKRDPKLLHAEIEQTALSTSLCHLGNIAYRLGREIHYNPETGRFINDSDADRLLSRRYRAPYVIPERA